MVTTQAGIYEVDTLYKQITKPSVIVDMLETIHFAFAEGVSSVSDLL